jgi:hypothetical protein
MYRTKFKCKNEQRAITLKKGKTELWFFTLHFDSMRYIYLQSFMLISLIPLELSSKYKLKKGNNSKIRQDRVTVLMHCSSTHWDLSTLKTSCWYLLLFRTRIADGRTNRRTKRRLYAHPMGSIKYNCIKKLLQWMYPKTGCNKPI